MKIAILVPSWPPGFAPNGIVTYASYLVPALRALGHEVFVLTGRKMSDDDPYTIDLQKFARPKTTFNKVMFRLAPALTGHAAARGRVVAAAKELATRHHIDVLEMPDSFGTSLAISRLNLLPVIVRLHGPWFLNGRYVSQSRWIMPHSRRERREGTAIKCAHFVTSPSADVLEAVRKHYGFRLEASRVIPNAITPAEPSQTWNANTCKPNTILFVGRFDAHKGGDVVLRAFAELAETHRDVRLTFVGPDSGIADASGDIVLFRDFLRNTIPEGLHSRIDFRGAMNSSDIKPFRGMHAITIVASRYDNFPNTVLEAMSFGSPIVATAVGGIPEMIKDQRNGLLVPSQDATAMANACRTLLDDRALAERLGRQAWLDCRDFHDPDVIAKQTIAAYQEAIDAFKSRKASHR
jgi:glycosyltransferase involved in cell wall biosynthesis